jgi:predicted peptidase
MSRNPLAVALAVVVVWGAPVVAAQDPFKVLQISPGSAARVAPIEALKRDGPALAASFTAQVHKSAAGGQMPYRLYTPTRLEPNRRYPLVVFLHGAGGSGTDNARQLQDGNVFGALVWTLPQNQARYPAFVLAPQSDVNWPCTIFDPKNPPRTASEITFCPPEDLGLGARLAFEIIDSLIGTLPVDRERIYVTGHSMGGAGTWHMIAHRPRFFAAAVPVCGHPIRSTAPAVKDVPIWNFHGSIDEVEPVASSRVMMDALRTAGGRPRYTEYAGVGHNVFMWAYTEPALIDWVFAQKR